MLISLFIKNFALIDEISLDFSPGLNVLTGETGAGKSIIVDAVQLLTGGRAVTEYIRTGQERAVVQGVYDLSRRPEVITFLQERGYLLEEDCILLMSRELIQGGKNICRINRQVTTLSEYREIGQMLIDLHGQQEQQTLLVLERHRYLLDKYGGPDLQKTLEEVKESFYQWQSVKKKLDQLSENADKQARNIELLKYQLDEIDTAALRAGEEEKLLAEKDFLVHAEKIAQLAVKGYNLLYQGEHERSSAIDLLGEASKLTRELAVILKEATPLLTIVESCLDQLKDVARELLQFYEKAEYDPERLAMVQERLEIINQLKRKYGGSIEEVLQRREEIAATLERLTSSKETFEALEKEVELSKKFLLERSSFLSKLRYETADKLKEKVIAELTGLGMQGINFKVEFYSLKEPLPDGAEKVEFLIAPNPGEPLKPLAKIASGGELARIMLALKSLIAEVDQVSTLIFDEVDTGIGGKVLASVAERLAYIGKYRQVICVTHAAQVAIYAKTHYTVIKETLGERTEVKVRLLDEKGRLREIARMLGGTEEDNAAKELARQMLEQAYLKYGLE